MKERERRQHVSQVREMMARPSPSMHDTEEQQDPEDRGQRERGWYTNYSVAGVQAPGILRPKFIHRPGQVAM